MKIAFVFGDFSIGSRPLDFNNIWHNPRGLTGSELGCVMMAKEMLARGHDVSIFTIYAGQKPDIWEGIKLYHLHQKNIIITSDWDAVISWNEPDQFRDIPQNLIRVVSEQLNGFTYCKPGFDNFVDIWASPSRVHTEYQKSFNVTDPNKWCVLPNGCDVSLYTEEKIPGRVIWASSADRGLHWLLQEWSKIKEAVPNATLKIFYNFNFGNVEMFEKNFYGNVPANLMEMGQRVRYMREMIEKLKPLGVDHSGSISRVQMAKEMSAAEVLAFPVSTTVFTEGFSVATLEGCASKACPVISDIDALGDIYGGVVPMVKAPVNKRMGEFSDLVIKALKDPEYRKTVNDRCYEFAKKHTWTVLAEQLEGILDSHPKRKK